MKFKQDVNERRDCIRLDFKLPVEVLCQETGKLVQGVSVNLGINGMLLQVEKDSVAEVSDNGKPCMARLTFQGKGSRLVIDELQSTICRIEENRVALQFGEPLEWFLLFTVYKDKQASN